MTAFADENILPVEETIAHKTDVLDWSGLELESCDLEFRGDFQLGPKPPWKSRFRLQTQLLSCLWRLGSSLDRSAIWLAPLLDRAACRRAVRGRSVSLGPLWSRPLADPSTRMTSDRPLIDPATLGRAFLPPLSGRPSRSPGDSTILPVPSSSTALVTLPLAMLVLRPFRHARGPLDHGQSKIGPFREDSSVETLGHVGDLLGLPGALTGTAATGRARSCLRSGLMAIAPLPLGCAVAVAAADTDAARDSCLWVVTPSPTTFGLAACRMAALFRPAGRRASAKRRRSRIVPCFFRMLVHWFYYGWKDRLPPWVFHSPCGGWISAAILRDCWPSACCAVPLTSLAAHSFAGLLRRMPRHVAGPPTNSTPCR